MGLIEIEFEFGKSHADRILIWLLHCSIYYPYHFIKLLSKNYSEIRSNNRIPEVTSINFKKSVYPFTVYFILIPTIFLFLIHKYINEDAFILVILVYASIIGVVFFLAIIYFLYRIIIDFLASMFCLLKSIILTFRTFKKSSL